ncbi:MAG: hypothetical protein ABI333_07015 [bacterium]
MLAVATVGCPVPVQYPLEPEETPMPPTVLPDWTHPYVGQLQVTEDEKPTFTVVVDEPNLSDVLEVKAVMGLDRAWSPDLGGEYRVMAEDIFVRPSDTLPPADASDMGVGPTVRKKDFTLTWTPCQLGSAGEEPFILVCVTDGSGFQAPPAGHPNNNPCIPRESAFVDSYAVMILCTL